MNRTNFTPAQLITALIVILLWGMNFVVIKIGLKGVPPLLLGALRFCFVAFPAILFLPRPKIPLKWLIAYACTISLGQFAFLFSAMAVGMPAGLASLVLQAQAFFTLTLSALIFGDRLRPTNMFGMLVAACGLYLLGSASMHNSGNHISIAGLVLTLCAALCWASGNIINKKIGASSLLSLVAWSALIPILPFFALSWMIEGPDAIQSSLAHISATSIFAIIYLAAAATLIGYTLWGKLLASLPTHKVAPLTLLVPVVGLSSAWILLGENLSSVQLIGVVVIMCGLLINVFGYRLLQIFKT